MSIPRATLRLQLHAGFAFADAAGIVPYAADLGVSHLYLSPILTARAGSMHGYDVIDPTRVNPELGGEEGFRALARTARAAGLGIVVDIVPNHMAIGADNPWWQDVLARGRASPHAGVFDIDWDSPDDPALRGKVLCPVLARPYGEALAADEIEVIDGGAVRHFDHLFPLAEEDRAFADRASLHALLERQHYRLAWWRTAGDEVNWRRFFDINELAGIRAEDPEIFERTHAAILRLYAEGLIDGLRVDHVDGLADPAGYCRRLRDRLAQLEAERPADAPPGPAWLVVEKILAAEERLPAAWPVDGTTGYDFMDRVSALLHDPAGAAPLADLWQRVSGRSGGFAAEEERARREIVERSFAGQLDACVGALHRAARADIATRDFPRAAMRRCMIHLLAHFPSYRSYEGDDGQALSRALDAAAADCFPGDRAVLAQMGRWLGNGGGAAAKPARVRFRQLSAPVAAKAVEDTAFYRYGRLLSRTDVGFDAGRFALSPEAFHAHARAAEWPGAMLATATHDHKRGEDVRARLAVLSELPDAWDKVLADWLAAGDGRPAPSAGDRAILFQMIVGSWPADLSPDDEAGIGAFAQRLEGWQTKALREAKLATDWTEPDAAYEAAAARFLHETLGMAERRRAIARFARRIAAPGAANALAQTLLKLTLPGVPDLYQGTEFWDWSLVDPDNRRPVDYAARQAALAEAGAPAALAPHWQDGRVKQAVIARTLAFRRENPGLFAEGEYLPLAVTGPQAASAIAFARRRGADFAVVVAGRLMADLMADPGRLAPPATAWRGTRVAVPGGWTGRLRDRLGPAETDGPTLELERILTALPVALLAP